MSLESRWYELAADRLRRRCSWTPLTHFLLAEEYGCLVPEQYSRAPLHPDV